MRILNNVISFFHTLMFLNQIGYYSFINFNKLNHQMTWQNELQDVIKSPKELIELLELNELADKIHEHAPFGCKVPRSFVGRMKKGDLNDPLLAQVLPLKKEEELDPDLSCDPLQESEFIQEKGVLQKFQKRVLVMTSGNCAVHCRYCFRRHFPYHEHRLSKKAWEEMVASLKEQPDIWEVILSGGDPLSLTDEHLNDLLQTLSTNPHLQVLRFHTRFPVVIPSRLTPDFIQMLHHYPLKIVMVLHINHAQELEDPLLREGLAQLKQAGVQLFNQAVLLKGVNDDLVTQEQLWRKCFDAGVIPYYLHQFDKVQGAGHFEVSVEKGLELIRELRLILPGYLVPSYVQEIPFAGSKVPLFTE